MNTVLAVLGGIVAAVIVIAPEHPVGQVPQARFDRAMGKACPDNKRPATPGPRCRRSLAAEAEEAKAATAAEPAKISRIGQSRAPAQPRRPEPEPAAAPKPESQTCLQPTPAKPETP